MAQAGPHDAESLAELQYSLGIKAWKQPDPDQLKELAAAADTITGTARRIKFFKENFVLAEGVLCHMYRDPSQKKDKLIVRCTTYNDRGEHVRGGKKKYMNGFLKDGFAPDVRGFMGGWVHLKDLIPENVSLDPVTSKITEIRIPIMMITGATLSEGIFDAVELHPGEEECQLLMEDPKLGPFTVVAPWTPAVWFNLITSMANEWHGGAGFSFFQQVSQSVKFDQAWEIEEFRLHNEGTILPKTGTGSLDSRKRALFKKVMRPPEFNYATYGHWDNANEIRKKTVKLKIEDVTYEFVGARLDPTDTSADYASICKHILGVMKIIFSDKNLFNYDHEARGLDA